MARKCPTCATDLKVKQLGEIQVDICEESCGGIWFDDLEIKKFDDSDETPGEALLSTIPRGATREKQSTAPRPCPKCMGEMLFRRFYDVQNQVEVDQCLKCSGIWLDPGELSQIRSQFKTEAERYAAADAYLDKQLEHNLAALHAEHNRNLAEIADEISTPVNAVDAGLRDLGVDNLEASFSEGLRGVFRALFR